MKKTNIEVEGDEIILQSAEGHYAIIPAKHRQEVMDMATQGCDDCINDYIQSLPKESDYAEDGSLISSLKQSKINPKNWRSSTITPEIQQHDELSAQDFTLDYIKSPKYEERLTKSGYKNPDITVKNRYESVSKIGDIIPTTVGSRYNAITGELFYDSEEPDRLGGGIDKEGILAHEFAHAETNPFNNKTRLAMWEQKEMYNRLKNIKSEKVVPHTNDIHKVKRPEETKADMGGLRYDLKKAGIYDGGTEDFKLKHLRKLKNSFFKDRLLDNFKKRNLKKLMNNIAENKTDIESPLLT